MARCASIISTKGFDELGRLGLLDGGRRNLVRRLVELAHPALNPVKSCLV